MNTLTSNEEPLLTDRDCIDWLDSPNTFHARLAGDVTQSGSERLGQAWMNELDPESYRKLTGSLYDPFFADDWPAVIRALRFLLEN